MEGGGGGGKSSGGGGGAKNSGGGGGGDEGLSMGSGNRPTLLTSPIFNNCASIAVVILILCCGFFNVDFRGSEKLILRRNLRVC